MGSTGASDGRRPREHLTTAVTIYSEMGMDTYVEQTRTELEQLR